MVKCSQMSKVKCQWSNVSERGFSLLEIVVVLTIFMIVMGVVVSIFLSMIKEQKKVVVEQELLNQISYATEYMARTIKGALADTPGTSLSIKGDIYSMTHTTGGFYSGIKFITQDIKYEIQKQ